MMRREWEDFLETNDSPNFSPSLLWEAGRAVIRGKIISYSYNKKQKKHAEKDIEEIIEQLTEEYTGNPRDHLWTQLQSKASGPDGFATEFIKHFWFMLAPLLLRIVTEMKNKGCTRTHMYTAAIK